MDMQRLLHVLFLRFYRSEFSGHPFCKDRIIESSTYLLRIDIGASVHDNEIRTRVDVHEWKRHDCIGNAIFFRLARHVYAACREFLFHRIERNNAAQIVERVTDERYGRSVAGGDELPVHSLEIHVVRIVLGEGWNVLRIRKERVEYVFSLIRNVTYHVGDGSIVRDSPLLYGAVDVDHVSHGITS